MDAGLLGAWVAENRSLNNQTSPKRQADQEIPFFLTILEATGILTPVNLAETVLPRCGHVCVAGAT